MPKENGEVFSIVGEEVFSMEDDIFFSSEEADTEGEEQPRRPNRERDIAKIFIVFFIGHNNSTRHRFFKGIEVGGEPFLNSLLKNGLLVKTVIMAAGFHDRGVMFFAKRKGFAKAICILLYGHRQKPCSN